MKIVVEFMYPPIPMRSHDWCAFDEDQADCDCYGDPPEFHWVGGPRGWGATRDEALKDLREQYEDDETLTPEVAAAIEWTRNHV